MKLDIIPPEALNALDPAFGTLEWVQHVLAQRDGSATFNEMFVKKRKTREEIEKAADAIKEAFSLGIVSLHIANAGKRGRPRYEFRLEKQYFNRDETK